MKVIGKGIILRSTIESDLHQIYTLWSEEISVNTELPEMTAEQLAELFASDNTIMLTAARKKNVLGFVISSVKECRAVIRWMLVIKKFRSTGIGRDMLDGLVELTLNKHGYCDITIIIEQHNTETERLLNTHDFKPGRRLVEFHKKINAAE